jgi:hypothetical protein
MLDPDLSIDMTVLPNGESGTLGSHGVTWRVLMRDGAVWLSGRELWAATLPADRAAALGDGWVRVTDPEAGFGWTKRLPTLAASISNIVFASHGPLAVSGSTTVGGRAAVELRGGADIYDVAATGTPWPLRWLDADIPGPGGQPCGVTLDRFDQPVTLPTPPAPVATLTPAPSPSPGP